MISSLPLAFVSKSPVGFCPCVPTSHAAADSERFSRDPSIAPAAARRGFSGLFVVAAVVVVVSGDFRNHF